MTQRDPIARRMAAAGSDSRLQREDSIALQAESRQARRQARSLRAESNAILESAAWIVSQVLAQCRIALAGPVDARFRTDAMGNTGVELTVTLQDPARAAAAREAIVERFGGEASCDSVVVR